MIKPKVVTSKLGQRVTLRGTYRELSEQLVAHSLLLWLAGPQASCRKIPGPASLFQQV